MEGLLLALGGNLSGPWGDPKATLFRACDELSQAGLRIVRSSKVYATAPLGPGRQAAYLNAVLLIETNVPPAALLRLVKRIERRGGRRLGLHWGPRCLDIDIPASGSDMGRADGSVDDWCCRTPKCTGVPLSSCRCSKSARTGATPSLASLGECFLPD
jgi:2-amino-4-hydroxy-6-hydroxymethyldihydropteridine diphosphokinase